MSGAELSVVLPFYNARETLREAIESLLSQDFANFVIIAVDDGSTDRGVLPYDPRIRLFRRGHAGIAAALNFALAQCETPFIARMDADDISLPQRFLRQMAALKDPALGVVSCRVEGFGGLSAGMQRYLGWINGLVTHDSILRERFIESPLVHPSVMWRRSIGVQYREDHGPEDYDLWLSLLARGVRFHKVDSLLFRWRDDAGRATRQDPRYDRTRFLECKLRYLLPLCENRDVIFMGAGIEGKPFLKALHKAGVHVPVVFDLDPRKHGNVIHGAKVLPPSEHPKLSDPLYLCAIGVPEARDAIRRDFAGRAREGENLFFLA